LKKLFAIAMLILILFNLGGYSLLFQYFIYRSDSAVLEQINGNHYKSSDLIEVKIPVHLNIQDWAEYAVVSGQVQLKDNSYNYAEIKLTRDTMYLLCIPNHSRTRLINANIIYARQVSDVPQNKKSPHIPLMKKGFSESEKYSILQYKGLLANDEPKPAIAYLFFSVTDPFIGIPGQPPEVSGILS
jgi:hypothetical protein